MSRILSRVRVVRSEEDRLESLADPSKWGDMDEKDPKSMARMMRRMGKELGEDVENVDEMIDEAMEEEKGTTSDKEPEE
jgi:hypothetical protein